MKRLAAWAAMIAATASVYGAQGRTAHVNFTYFGVSDGVAVRIGDDCFMSSSMATKWGWRVEPESAGRFRVTVGDREMDVPAVRVGGQEMLSLTDIAQSIDAAASWRAHSDVLDVTSRVRVIRFMNGHLSICASLPVSPLVSLTSLGGTTRVLINLRGATMSDDAIVDAVGGLQITAPKPGAVLLSMPVPQPFAIDPRLSLPAANFDIDTTVAKAQTMSDVQPSGASLHLDDETQDSLSLSMSLPVKLSRAPNFARIDPTTLRIWLPGVQVQLSGDPPNTASIRSVQADQSPGGTQLTFVLSRPMGITVSTENGLHIRFVKPPVGDGKLSGKIIVVDAGHGGKDSGTKSIFDGFPEKALTLPISKLIAADLASEGATVIMTRQTDVFIPLEERAAIANRNHANLFLCVHINSNGRNTTTSGSITFYHKSDPVSSTLADCIEREISAASGIPGIGIWSDTKIYHTGFSVLRNTRMPAVLMELGFMDNSHDRQQLVKKDVQEAIAAAVVKGVKVYLGQTVENEK